MVGQGLGGLIPIQTNFYVFEKGQQQLEVLSQNIAPGTSAVQTHIPWHIGQGKFPSSFFFLHFFESASIFVQILLIQTNFGKKSTQKPGRIFENSDRTKGTFSGSGLRGPVTAKLTGN